MEDKICGVSRADFNSDADWLQAVINANPSGEIHVPSGHYELDKPVVVENGCAVSCERGAVFTAVEKMDYMFVVSHEKSKGVATFKAESEKMGYPVYDFREFLKGATFNGNGLASCLLLKDLCHYTLSECVFLNGKPFGLRLENGYELIASNCYFRTSMSGLAGNVALSVRAGDHHFVDIVVVDYTVGFDLGGENVGANRLERCHVWGGPLPPVAEGRDCEMLENSVAFICASGDNLLRDCYADTSKIGYLVSDWTRLLGCAFFNNPCFKLENTTVIRHLNDEPLTVTDGHFTKNMPGATLFEGSNKNVIWANNRLCTWQGYEPYEVPEFVNETK